MRPRNAALPFILFTIFLDLLAVGIVIPVLPQLVEELAPGQAADAALYVGLAVSVYFGAQFLFQPALGALSDRFGRRPVLLISIAGIAVNNLVLAFAPTLLILFIGRFLAGASAANMSVANAYIADISAPEDRARRYGYVSAAFGLGFILGPAVGGMLGQIDLRWPFFLAAGLGLLNLIYGALVLPESLRPENRRAFDILRANPVGAFRVLMDLPRLHYLFGALLCFGFAQATLHSMWVIYTTARYGWDSIMTGMSLALVGVFTIIVQAFLLGRLLKSFGEQRLLIGGLVLGVGSYIIIGAAPAGWIVLLSIPLMTLGGVSQPAAQGLVSANVAANQQGTVQGAMAGLITLMSIIAPPIAGKLFGVFGDADGPVTIPGIPFFLAAVAMVLGVLLATMAVQRGLKVEPAADSGNGS